MAHGVPSRFPVRQLVAACGWGLVLAAVASARPPTSTAITYQGQLKVAGVPLNGTSDVRFRLYDDAVAGDEVGGTLFLTGSTLTNGLLTVDLDFSSVAFPAPFNGDGRWLEIAVRTPTGVGSYTLLGPRQPLLPTPYALYALNGNPGPAGPQGSTGAQGATGATGAPGPAGTAGAQGATGATGAPGPAGAAGAQGAEGATGAAGPAGVTGATGTPGAQGAPGPVDIVASIDMQFSQDDRSAWTHVETLGDDTCFLGIPLGFTFTGWGRADAAISVSSNGVLFFGQSCSSTFSNTVLPSGISPNPLLAFFWDDLLDYGAG